MSYLQKGICKYCGDTIMVEAASGTEEEILNELASERCNCIDAEVAKKRKEQRLECEKNLQELIAPEYPRIANILIDGIELIQDGVLDKITIKVNANQKVIMSHHKDGIKVELEKKQKQESLA